MELGNTKGTIFNIQKFSVHDGPGIRTTVFMKGCPLRCQWCANSESLNPQPESGIIRDNCNNCGRCIDVCPVEAISISKVNIIHFDRTICDACGDCAAICPTDAITIYGKQVTVDEVFSEINRDKAFYDGSGGGVTVSGGEPLRQAEFTGILFQKCREHGISTCLDTSGYADTTDLKKVLDFTDYVLFDIKHMDNEQHCRYTRMSNDLILANARIIAERGVEVLFRIPLVENVNDSIQNITATARFIKSLGNGSAVELLPYHRLGAGKYRTLDLDYPGKEFTAPSAEKIESVKHIFEGYEIPCSCVE
ncbi:glycyl-radical enzyme activating protein [Chloroflexota bacterium]